MKLLAVVQHFRQGWGGVPESIRLLARVLRQSGVSVDVYDRGLLHRAVESLDLLPEPGARAPAADLAMVGWYDAILIAGPWQDARHLRSIVKARRKGQPLIYLPRGGLARIEFAQLRDAKKWPYFYFVERRLLDACSAVVYSSECEQRHTIAAARHRTSEIVIPDFFEAEPALPDIRGVVADEVRFSFMAAIAPRKGSLPLVEGFVEFARAIGPGEKVRLVVAGFVRRGSEAYHARELAIAARAPANAAIEFIGPVKDADRASFYRDTDVFLVPSVFESFGLTVLEGVAAGCAEITGPELGVLEYLPADSGLTIAQAISPAAIAEALRVRYELARSQRRSEREATRTRAASAIADLNGLAKARWLELLSG